MDVDDRSERLRRKVEEDGWWRMEEGQKWMVDDGCGE